MVKIIKIGTAGLQLLYNGMKLLPTQKKIVMLSRQSNEPSDEFRMVEHELLKQNKGVKVVLLCKTLDGGVDSSLVGKIRYGFHMLTQMYHLATAQVAVLDTYCITVSLIKHKN